MKKTTVLLENGLLFEANSFGAMGTFIGEIVFNTSITGYQEIISDPSYAGQFITFTTPEIGNVGTNLQDMESKKAFCKGIIVRNFNKTYSNFRGEIGLDEFLKKHNVIGLTDVDTRSLTKLIRQAGTMMMVASTEIHSKKELENILNNSPKMGEINYLDEVGTKTSYIHKNGVFNISKFNYNQPKKFKAKIIAIDFGIKRNILNELTEAGIEVEVIPNNFKVDSIIQKFQNGEIKGIFLSNGPGDPLVLKEVSNKIAKLIDAKIPMFGICLGHQLISIAQGYPTYKLKFGHHGGNHPVKNLKTNMVEITAQNHNYSVPENIENIAEVTHKNLFDNTIEGLIYKNVPVFSVQHHPESSPGPQESNYIFQQFVKNILNS